LAPLVTKGTVSSYLAIPTLQYKTAVYFCSLSLKSPSPAVNRHPCPAMLGLSSRYFRSPQPYN